MICIIYLILIYRYTIYEDHEKIVTSSKQELYDKLPDGGDWFTDYEDDDIEDPFNDNDRHHNDYRHTECISSILPPNLFEQEQPGDTKSEFSNFNRNEEGKGMAHGVDREFNMTQPRLQIKQNNINHKQDLKKYTCGKFSIKAQI